MDAIICEIGEDTVTILHWKFQLVKLPKSQFVGDVELGKCYVFNNNMYELCSHNTVFEVWVTDGVVHAKVLGIAPNESDLVRDGLLNEYQNTAYSYHLRLLADPNSLFFSFPNMEVAVATVKYAPTRKTAFEVVAVADPSEDPSKDWHNEFLFMEYLQIFAPWSMEANEQNKRWTAEPPLCASRFSQQKRISPSMTFEGVCVLKIDAQQEADYRAQKKKLLFEENYKKGENVWSGQSRYRTDFQSQQVFYSFSLGMCRTYEKEKEVEVGGWYQFKMTDNRKNRMIANGRRPEDSWHYRDAKVRDLVPMQNPIPSESLNGRIQMRTSFVFNHDELKFHFLCQTLGKVEIAPQYIGEIITKIEKHRANLKADDPSKYQDLKDKKFGVEVGVELIYFNYNTFHRNPEQPCFSVNEVYRIFYFIGGEVIYEKELDQ